MPMSRRIVIAPALLLLVGTSAHAADSAFVIPIAPTLAIADAPAPASVAFGDPKSSDWLSVGGGAAFSTENTDANVYLTWHTFIAQDFEFNLTLGGWYFFQEGEDAAGINPAFGFRWHFINKQSFSIYADFGIGLLASTDDVPSDGTSFNFTPRAGIGSTIALGEGSRAPRLDVGVRWFHISNASFSGSDDNPSRDSLMVYLGVMFPI